MDWRGEEGNGSIGRGPLLDRSRGISQYLWSISPSCFDLKSAPIYIVVSFSTSEYVQRELKLCSIQKLLTRQSAAWFPSGSRARVHELPKQTMTSSRGGEGASQPPEPVSPPREGSDLRQLVPFPRSLPSLPSTRRKEGPGGRGATKGGSYFSIAESLYYSPLHLSLHPLHTGSLRHFCAG